jgi:hypothetical protein
VKFQKDPCTNVAVHSEHAYTDRLPYIMIINNRKAVLDTDLDYGSYRLPYLEKGLTTDVIDRHGMLTPPWYLRPVQQSERLRLFACARF